MNSNNWISNLLPAPKNDEGHKGHESKAESQTESVSSQQTSKEPSPANTPVHNIRQTEATAANMPMVNQPSPIKAVNLLPEVPEVSSSGRKLSDREKRDCEVIGKKKITNLFVKGKLFE